MRAALFRRRSDRFDRRTDAGADGRGAGALGDVVVCGPRGTGAAWALQRGAVSTGCESEAGMMHEPAAGRTPSNLVRRLADVTDERLVGGNARNLARLVALGVRVPDGVVLTSAAFNRFLDSNAMRDRIDAWCHQIDVNHPESLQSCSEKIAELINNGFLPREIQGLIRE